MPASKQPTAGAQKAAAGKPGRRKSTAAKTGACPRAPSGEAAPQPSRAYVEVTAADLAERDEHYVRMGALSMRLRLEIFSLCIDETVAKINDRRSPERAVERDIVGLLESLERDSTVTVETRTNVAQKILTRRRIRHGRGRRLDRT